MRNVRMMALAALLAAFALPAAVPPGRSLAQDAGRKSADIEIKVNEKRSVLADRAGLAYALIEIARRKDKESPTGLLTAVGLLASSGPGVWVGPGDDEVEVEGGEVVKDQKFFDGLRDLIKEAAAMPGGKGEAAAALAKDVAEQVDASERYDRATGFAGRRRYRTYLSTLVVVKPGGRATIKCKMWGGIDCSAAVAKVANAGDPLQFKVTAPDGTVVRDGSGDVMRAGWLTPKGPDAIYTIEIVNPRSSVEVTVRVITN
jgi:hypothetical protein